MSQDAIYALIPIMAIACGIVAIIANAVNNMVRAKHGYPLLDENGKLNEGGRKLVDGELTRQNELLAGENERLKAQLLRVEERVSVLERIATDQPTRLSHEIEALRA